MQHPGPVVVHPVDPLSLALLCTVPCDRSPAAVAACQLLGTLVIACTSTHSLQLFRMRPGADMAPVGTLGSPGTGPLEFDFTDAPVALAFTVPQDSTGMSTTNTAC